MKPQLRADDADLLAILEAGTITIEGRLVDASNATLFGNAELDGADAGEGDVLDECGWADGD